MRAVTDERQKNMNSKKTLKSYFFSLNSKERFGLGIRILLLLSYSAILMVMGCDIGLTTYDIYITIIGMIAAALFFGPVLFFIVFCPLVLILAIETHLFFTYGYSLLSFGTQLGRLISDTNKAEILEYIPKLGMPEITMLALFVLCLPGLFFYKPKMTGISKLWKSAIFITVFLSCAFGCVSRTRLMFLSIFSSEQADILAKANAFHFFPYKQKTKADTVVLLIGESHRQAEFSPTFDKYAGRFPFLYRFSDMISQYPGTIDSIPMILSRKKATDHMPFFHEKSIFSLFKEAGYETYFVHYVNTSSEKNELSLIYREADNFIQYEKNITAETDKKILPVLDEILSKPAAKKLIVIKMIGAHVSFANRYPRSNAFFKNVIAAFKKPTKEKELYHYNNAISYSAEIIADIMTKINNRKEPSLLFFSSDHGICIFDKGSLHLPPNCQNAFHIPAMILLNPALNKITKQTAKDNLACNTDKPLTEEYDFETIATLAGITYPAADKKYDLTQHCNPLKGKKRPVYFINETALYEDL